METGGERTTEQLAARFPADFTWGVATSAYQIEGAAAEDGRGPSIWDTFARQPARVVNGHTGDAACDHYHRYRDDVALMAELGARSYRFSISWPRVMPSGKSPVNERGLDFYRRLVDELAAAGVKPMLNLFHWDLPQLLQDAGGFGNADIVGRFADYTALIAARLGDAVTDWMTLNEPAVFAFLGHAHGIHAPGLRHWPTAIRVADNQLRAHAAAVEVIRDVVPNARIGVAMDLNHVVPATDSDRDARAAERYRAARDTWFLDPLFGRGYPQLGVEAHREAGHLEGIDLTDPPVGDLDYVGMNYYRQESVAAGSDRAFDWSLVTSPNAELTDMQWEVVPDGLRQGLEWVNHDYAPKEIIISENGAAYPDRVGEDGVIHDADRISYLARHVAAAADARDAGVPLAGFYAWSFMDNYEWSLGYSKRFGLVHVDYPTQRRTPKDSARWFRRLARARA